MIELSGKKLKYPPEFKKEVCEAVKGLNIKNASVMYGLNSDTVGRWFRKYKVDGESAFIRKRKDTNKTKLSKDTAEAIRVFRYENPKITLLEIKKQFRLDCSLPLISRKTKPDRKLKKYTTIKGDIFLISRKVYEIKFKNEISTLFEFSLFNSSEKRLFTGFTKTKDSRNICLFVRLALSSLGIERKKPIRIITGIHYIKTNDFNTIVSSAFNSVLLTGSKICLKRTEGLCASYKIKNATEVIYESYRNYLYAIPSSSRLKNNILIPIVNLDRNKSDNTILGMYSLPGETKKAVHNVVKDLKTEGENATLEFNYSKAEHDYTKAYAALMSSRINNPELQLELLSKRAELLYNTEKYHASLMLFRDCLAISRSLRNKIYLGNSYYFLGMIYNLFHNRRSALKYLLRSIRTTERNDDILFKIQFFRAKLKADLIKRNYSQAYKSLKYLMRYSDGTGNSEIIGNTISQYGLLFYYKREYNRAGIWYKKALKYNIEKQNIFNVCDNIQGLINIYALGILKNTEYLQNLLAQLTEYARKAGIPHIAFEAEYQMGIYFYKKSEFQLAEKYLLKALQGNKINSPDYFYVSNLYYLGRVYYASGNGKALRFINELVRVAVKIKNSRYSLYANRIMSKIYYDKSNFKKACILAKEVFKISVKLNELYIAGEANKMLGMIAERKSFKKSALKYFNKALMYFGKFTDETKVDIAEEINSLKKYILNKIPSE